MKEASSVAPYIAETTALLETLKKYGLNPIGARYNEPIGPGTAPVMVNHEDPADIVDNGDVILYVRYADDCDAVSGGRVTWVRLLFGNDPGELMADWGIPDDAPEMEAALDAVLEEHGKAMGAL